MREISVEELKQRVDNGEQLNVLDVRDPDEYAEFNIGAKLLPLGNIINMQIDDIDEWKDKEVIVHCRSGKRSMQACMVLEQMGFADTVNVTGGILAWEEKFGTEKLK
ncbi:MAG: rhodanese-like domain-containing protein [Chitinophagaceae bacterium]|nr:rhodanese-like domain-containing protein [Chitinophagaceae bacterium]